MDGVEKERICNMIFFDLVSHKPTEKIDRHYLLGPKDGELTSVQGFIAHINVSAMMKGYPFWMLDRFDMALRNSYYYFEGLPILDDSRYTSDLKRICMCDSVGQGEYTQFIQLMKASGYLVDGDVQQLVYTQKAWDRLSELIQRHEGSNLVFIALGYTGTSEIRKSIKEAVVEAGYEPVVMDETQHNNLIVPEMFDYIKRCRFLIMDMTYPNYGAYYEAGLARGMGKQTILTCRSVEMHSKDSGVRPHFDVAQQSTVVWDNFEDLKVKLVTRIKMTID